ncbi:MAG: SIR2 family protein [Bacteroidetes bacterium]|nr:SIR2 family protein [Bacteroidota bacterium]
MITQKEFKKKYLKALLDNNAALFAGAGLSVESGMVNWKELLKEIAEDIGLDIKKETDLVAVAQYHKNERIGRATINQEIIEHFTEDIKLNNKHLLLTRLPIKWYWTTNYDQLIEEALINANKKIDVKITQENLATNKPKTDVIVYKMHGDVNHPSSAVVTKDDYESYNLKRQLFTTTLQGDLISKTFLFIGFSFEDPNLEYILSRIRILLGENTREHFAFFKRVNRKDFDKLQDFKYAQVKQELRIKDLKRYSIFSVLVDSYDEIDEILADIEKLYYLNKVFISGSAESYEDWDYKNAIELMHKLSEQLIKSEFKIVTGFGLGVGSIVINGALSEIYKSKFGNSADYLELKPFPQISSGGIKLSELWESYRQEMISKCGIAIFLFGNKKGEDEKIIDANGVYREYEIAKDKDLIIIPIGSTGFAAQKIFDEIKRDIKKYPYLKKYLKVLQNSKNTKEIIGSIVQIITSETKEYLN